MSRDGGVESASATARSFEIRSSSGLTISSHAGASGGGDRVSNCDVDEVFEFGVEPFFTPCGPLKALGTKSEDLDFSLKAPTTAKNLHRVLRAMQVIGGSICEGGGCGVRCIRVTRVFRLYLKGYWF